MATSIYSEWHTDSVELQAVGHRQILPVGSKAEIL
jgi:hypothetical protein